MAGVPVVDWHALSRSFGGCGRAVRRPSIPSNESFPRDSSFHAGLHIRRSHSLAPKLGAPEQPSLIAQQNQTTTFLNLSVVLVVVVHNRR